MKKTLAALAVVALCATACNKTAPTGFTGTFSGNLSNFGTTRFVVPITKTGTVTIKLTWTDASANLDLILAGASCQTVDREQCNEVLNTAFTNVGTTETIVQSVTAGTTYVIYVRSLNLANVVFSGTIDVPASGS